MSEAAQRRLLDRLRPDTSRTGRVRRFLATTHDLQADFFDGDFLCTALSIAQADFAGHSGQLALQRKLAGLEYSGVLCEARAYSGRPSLRTVVHPVTLRSAVLHAKLVVIEYEHAVRVLIGSANLTAQGYRYNREVLGELLAHRDENMPLAQAVATLRSAREVLTAFDERAAEFLRQLDAVVTRLESWIGPQASAAGTSPVIWSDGARPLWRSLLERWPAGTSVERLRIVSPFWCEDGTRETPLRRLLKELQTRKVLSPRCQVGLYMESSPLAGGGFVAEKTPAVYFSDFSGVSVRVIPVDPTVAPSDLDVKVELNAARKLHAKVLVLEGRDRALAYAGSANFTRRGFGLRRAVAETEGVVANIEAGWVFELSKAAVIGLLPPAANAGFDLPSLVEPNAVAAPEPEDEPTAFWPETLLSADLTPSAESDALELTTTWAQGTPAGWTVRTARQELARWIPESALLTTTASGGQVTTPLSPSDLQAILRQRHVLVVAAEGQAAFPVNVAAGEARLRLPLSSAGSAPGEDDLLAYYQGRITFDDLYPGVEEGGEGLAAARGAARAQHGVDKSRIQAYQIRDFVDALAGIKRELLGARGSQGMLYQAFRGEVSPVALARHVTSQVGGSSRSVTAGAFQLVELLALLKSVASEAPPDVEHYAETCERARSEIDACLVGLRQKHAQELGPKSAFSTYASKVLEVGA